MKIRDIYIFGNPDLPADSLPLKILPELRNKFPQLQFEVKDPNEEWDVPEELTIIDTVEGIEKVTIFDDLAKFVRVPRLTLHDFDALSNLLYLQKLGKLKKIKIIGLLPMAPPDEVLKVVSAILSANQL